MTSISLKDFAAIADKDEAMRKALAACKDRRDMMTTLNRLASERGYQLQSPQPPRMERISDDLLDEVAGGKNMDLLQLDEELNSYSWFVTLLQRILGRPERP